MKPREFWIDCAAPEENYAGDAFFEHPRQGPLLWQHCLVHVREISPEYDAAVEKLVEALEKITQHHGLDKSTPGEVIALASYFEAEKALEAFRKASE